MVKIKRLMILFYFIGCYQCVIISQTLHDDVLLILESRPTAEIFNIKRESAPTPISLNQTSEIKLLFVGLIRAYQLTISSQDMPTCVFHPSCSRFSSMAFQRAGMIKGSLLTFDRLQRCNGIPAGRMPYKFNFELGKFLDPVDNYTSEEPYEPISH